MMCCAVLRWLPRLRIQLEWGKRPSAGQRNGRNLRGTGSLLRSFWRRVAQLRALWLIAAGRLVGGTIIWAALVEPAWLLPDVRGLSPADRLKALTDFRSTLVTMLAGLAVAAGAIVAALNFQETSHQNRAIQEQNRAVLEVQRRGQVT